jgi:hypothetical protein
MRLEGRCSVQLSYGRVELFGSAEGVRVPSGMPGIVPATCLQVNPHGTTGAANARQAASWTDALRAPSVEASPA